MRALSFCFIIFIVSCHFKPFWFCYNIGLVTMTWFTTASVKLVCLWLDLCQPPSPQYTHLHCVPLTYWPFILNLLSTCVSAAFFPFYFPYSYHLYSISSWKFSSSWTPCFYSHILITCDIYLGTLRGIIFNMRVSFHSDYLKH